MKLWQHDKKDTPNYENVINLEVFKEIMNKSCECVFIVNARTGSLVFFNDASQKIGYTEEELRKMKITDISMNCDWNSYKNEVTKNTCLKKEDVYKCKDGTKVEVETDSIYIKHGERELIGIVVHDVTGHKIREAELKKEKEEIQKYIDLSGTIFVVIGKDQNVEVINKKGCDILGYSKNEIVGKNWFDNFIPDRLKENVKSVFSELVKGNIESLGQYENPIITKSGEEKMIEWQNTIIRDEKGNILSTLSSGEDITQKKKYDEVIVNSEKRFRKLIENISDIITITDLDGKLNYVSESVKNILGYKPNELLGKRAFELIHSDDVQYVASSLVKISQNPDLITRGEFRIKHKDGSWHWVEGITKNMLMDKSICGIVSALRDITERKNFEENLIQIEKRYELIENATNDAVWDLDLITNDIKWNENFWKMFRYKKDEIKVDLEGWSKRIHPEDKERIDTSLNKSLKSNESSWSGEYRFLCGDGSYAFILDRGYIARDKNGKAVRMIGSMMDITEHKQAEEKITEHAKELEKLNKFMVGRELRIVELKKENEELRKKLGELGNKQ